MALISVLILLFTLFLHLICRVFVFVVRLRLLLQFVCVFFLLFFKSSVGICISRYVVCLCICIYLVVHLCTIMILFFFSRRAFEVDVAVPVLEFALAVCLLCLSFSNFLIFFLSNSYLMRV